MPTYTINYLANPVYASSCLTVSASTEREAILAAEEAVRSHEIESWDILGLKVSDSPAFKISKTSLTRLAGRDWLFTIHSQVERPTANIDVEAENSQIALGIADDYAKDFHWNTVNLGGVVPGPYIKSVFPSKRRANTTLTIGPIPPMTVGVPFTVDVSVGVSSFEPAYLINPSPMPNPVGRVRISLPNDSNEVVYSGPSTSITLVPTTSYQDPVPLKFAFFGSQDSEYSFGQAVSTYGTTVQRGSNVLSLTSHDPFSATPRFNRFTVQTITAFDSVARVKFYLGPPNPENLFYSRNIPTNQSVDLMVPFDLDPGSNTISIVSTVENFQDAIDVISVSV